MDFMTNEDRKHSPPKPRGRRGMPVIGAKKGFAVSVNAAKALIAKGAADARPRQPSMAPETSKNVSAAEHFPSTSAIAGHQATSSASAGTLATSVPTVIRSLFQARSDNNILQFQRDEDTISAPNSAVSGPSSGEPDDPRDTSYGQRAQRKPATTNTPAGPRKTAFTIGKKRKSTEGVTPAKKRSRPSVDGAADDN